MNKLLLTAALLALPFSATSENGPPDEVPTDTGAAGQAAAAPGQPPGVPPATVLPGWRPPQPAPFTGWQPGQWTPPRRVAPHPGYRQYPPPMPPPRAAWPGEHPAWQSRLQASEHQLAQARTELKQLESALQELRSELADARETQQQAQAQQRELRETLQTTRDEHQAAQTRIAQLDAELDKAGTALAQSNARLESRQQLLETMQEQRAARVARLAGLEAQLANASAALQQARAQNAGLQQAQAQLGALRNRATTLEAEVTRLEAQLGTRDTRLAALEFELESTTASLQQAQGKITALEQYNAQLAQARIMQQAESAQAGGHAAPPREIAAMESTLDTARAPATAAVGAADEDADGVPDTLDLCLNTPDGNEVDDLGCPLNEAIALEGVNFYYDSYKLTGRGRMILNRVASVLERHDAVDIEIAGHTDSQGDPQYNQWLSEQRAVAVKDYLVSRGLDPAQFITRGYGDRQPLTDNSTRPGLRANRRVELRRLP